MFSEPPLRSVSQLVTKTVAFCGWMKPQLPPQLPQVPITLGMLARLSPLLLRKMSRMADVNWNSFSVPTGK